MTGNEMTAYGQGCFDNGFNKGFDKGFDKGIDNGVIIGEERKCRQIIINLLKIGYDKSSIKEIASCDDQIIEDSEKEYKFKNGI